jgi:hypothetical protein
VSSGMEKPVMKSCMWPCSLSLLVFCSDPAITQQTEQKPDSKAEATNKEGEAVSEKPTRHFRHEALHPKGAPPEDCQFAAGYYDEKSDTFYRWKGVTFPASQSPYKSPYRRLPYLVLQQHFESDLFMTFLPTLVV